MPSGTPAAQMIIDQRVGGFALDTSIIRASGYRFNAAPLAVLAAQLPAWVRLYLPDVVVNEVLRQQVDGAMSHLEAAKSAVRSLERNGLRLEPAVAALDKAGSAADLGGLFRDRIARFVRSHRGEVVAMGDLQAQKLFERYFAGTAPFGRSKERKSEFPDAAALLMLEATAKRQRTAIIAVSADKAWGEFADASKHLYCVPTLDDLTRLFVSDAPAARAIEARLRALLADASSPLVAELKRRLDLCIGDLGWTADAHSGVSARLEPSVEQVGVRSFEADTDSLRLWMSPDDSGQCIAEVDLRVLADFVVIAEFYLWDSIDRDEVYGGSASKNVQEDVTVTAFVTLSGELTDGDPGGWDVDVELADVGMEIEAGEMEIDFRDYEE